MSVPQARRVLVTGGSGFIGSALVARLRHDGHSVEAPGREQLDLLKPIPAQHIPERLDVLVHGAAARDRASMAGAASANWAREIATNLDATARLYDAARRSGVRAIVHVSTISVIAPGPDPRADLSEDAPLVTAPSHPYGVTKLWAENLCISLRGDFEAIAIVRPGMTYSPAMPPEASLARIATSIERGDEYGLAPPDGHRYAPVFLDDVVDVLARVAAQPSNSISNVAGQGIWERDMVSDIATQLGIQPRFGIDHSEAARSVVPASASIDALFPTRVRTPWHDGVRRTFAGRRRA